MAPEPNKSKRKKPVRRPLSTEELAMRKFWEVRYVAMHLGVKRDWVVRRAERLIERSRFVEGVDYWNAKGKVNNHFLISRDSGIRKLMLEK
jgi:hypothetical protein